MDERIRMLALARYLLRHRLPVACALIVTLAGVIKRSAAQSTSAAPAVFRAGQAAPIPPRGNLVPAQQSQGMGVGRTAMPDIRLVSSVTAAEPTDARSVAPNSALRSTPSGTPLLQPSEFPRSAGDGTDYGPRSSSVSSGPRLPRAPLEATDVPLPLNLASALQLADVRPLIVAAAQASAWVAEAQLQRAKLIKIPELDIGTVYVRHDGFGPDFGRGVNNPVYGLPGGGGPLNQNLNAMWVGGSLYAVFPMTDAIFQPLVARQVLDSRRFDIQAAKNDALLATANTYFHVHQARGQYAGAIDVVKRGEALVDRVARLSKDLVPRIEVDRAMRMLADMQQHAVLARQSWRVASANLTEILRLDPRVVVIPLEPDRLQITLFDPARPLDELMPIAMRSRPEIASQRALVRAAQQGIRQEKNRPLLPTILVTGFQTPGDMRMQATVFGLGSGASMSNWSLRDDVSMQAIWQLEGLGLGNLARIKKQRGMESNAIIDLYKLQDLVVAEVTRSQANLQSAAVRVIEAERSLREAIITFDGNYEGLTQTKRFDNVLVQVYRPQEVVISLENLRVAYDQYFGTVADYNRAQFELFHALGYPAREVSALRPPGDYLPVDTNRPRYLPPVGVGPPPATR
jgi:outer membrane protein TolC